MVEKQIIKTGSENTIKAYNYLEANKDEAFTIKQIADANGLSSPQVTGGVVSLTKKGVLTRGVTDVDGKEYKTFQWAAPAEFELSQGGTTNISDKGVRVLQYLQKHQDEDLAAIDIAEGLGDMLAIAVNGVVNGLVKRDLVVREEAIVEMPDGKEKTIKFIVLTEEGKNYKF